MFKILQNDSRRMIEKKESNPSRQWHRSKWIPSPTWVNKKSFMYILYKKKYQLVMAAFFPVLVTLAKCVIPVTFFVLKGSSCIISRHWKTRKVHLFVCCRQYYFHNLRIIYIFIQLYLQTVPRVVIVSRINDEKRSVYK